MSLMNAISRGVSSAAGQGAEIYARGAAEDQRAEIQAERDARLEELKEKYAITAETRKNAPLNRISANAQAKLGEEVPLEAAPVTNLSGVNEAGKKFGFQGDLKTVRDAIAQMPEGDDKTAALAQLQGQLATDTKTGLINVAGKTRKRTGDEALDAAVQDAKVSDLSAYADYEARVGKPLRDERKIDVGEANANARAAASAKGEESKERRQALQIASNEYIAGLKTESSERNTQARLEALVKANGGGANGTKEALSFIDGARKELANDAANLNKMYISDTKDAGSKKLEAMKAEYKPKFEALDIKRSQIESDFRALREKVGLPAMNKEEPTAAAPPKPVAAKPGATATTRPPLSSFQK